MTAMAWCFYLLHTWAMATCLLWCLAYYGAMSATVFCTFCLPPSQCFSDVSHRKWFFESWFQRIWKLVSTKMYRHFFKRLIDIVLSFIGIVVLALPMLVFAFIIKAEDPGPVFFRQKRIGIHKTQFSLLKFRSMKISTPHDMPTHMLENPEQYILRCGRWMRKMSIDELPQLFNIFTGDSGIIGTTKKNLDFKGFRWLSRILLW